jgi:hypothetical protein
MARKGRHRHHGDYTVHHRDRSACAPARRGTRVADGPAMLAIRDWRETGHRRFVAEAERARLAISPTELVELEDKPTSRGLRQIAKLAVVGEAGTRLTHVRAYALGVELGPALYIVGFDGSAELTGEFHLRLAGAVPAAAAFAKRAFGKRWACEDPAVRARLTADRALAAATKRLSWKKHNALGSVPFHVAVQVSAIGGGRSQLVMQSGTYGLVQQDAGIDVFLAIARAIAPHLDAIDGDDSMYFETYFHALPWLDSLWQDLERT